AEGLDVGVDPLDVVDPLPRQRGQTQTDRHDHLATDDEVELDEQVVVLADRAVDDVLDRYDAGRGLATGDDVEYLAEAAERGALDIPERREDGVLRERPRLTRVGDRHGVGAARRHSMESGGCCRWRGRSRSPAR